ILLADVAAAMERHQADRSSHFFRRTVIRTSFSAIEGLVWTMKQSSVALVEAYPDVYEPEDLFVLKELSYAVTPAGRTYTRPLFLPVTAGIKLVLTTLNRNPWVSHTVDLNHPSWSALHVALRVRHRLTHPKTGADLLVSESDVRQAVSAHSWTLATTL